jgi:hypothetical protein
MDSLSVKDALSREKAPVKPLYVTQYDSTALHDLHYHLSLVTVDHTGTVMDATLSIQGSRMRALTPSLENKKGFAHLPLERGPT